MASILGQFRQVCRRLRRAPLFTAVTLLTLAVGIGANTVVFSVVDGVLLKPLAYPHPAQLAGIGTRARGVTVAELTTAPFLYFVDREQNTTLQDMGVYQQNGYSLTGTARPEHLEGLNVTDGVLPILDVKPELGRLFTRQDDQPNASQTVLLTYGYWQRRYGGDRNIVGRSIMLDGSARTIIGVLPESFKFLDYQKLDVILPLQFDRSKTKLGNFSFSGIARLKPGVTQAQADADLDRLIPIAIRSFPPPQGFSISVFENARFSTDVHSLKKDVVGDIGNLLWILMGSIGIVLLVACANVANLLLVRVEGRRQELAIRTALGAGRGSITRDLLVESLTLGFAGSLLGLMLADGALQMLVAAAPTGLPRLNQIGIDAPVLLFTLALALFVSLVIGMIPVLKYAGVRASTGLREGGRGMSQSRERHRARKVLVVVQVALALVLLICSGLMIRTFRALANVSPGVSDPAALDCFSIFIPDTQIPSTDRVRVVRTEQAIAEQLAAIPEVSSVGLTTNVPLSGDYSFDPVYAEDHVYREGELAPVRSFKFISPGYFSTVGTRLIAGRDMTWDEEFQKRPVAIISENFAREYWGSAANAVGKFIRAGATDDWHEVIGVAGNVYDDGVSKPPSSAVYWPLYQQNFDTQKEMVSRYINFVIRTPRAGQAEFRKQVEQAVWRVDPDLPLAEQRTVGELYTKSMERTSFMLVVLCVAGSMALLLGVIGIYGVIAYAVSQRTREIGIRMALGAQRETLTGMFVRQGLVLTGIGIVTGIAVAFATMRLMGSILFHVTPLDPLTYSLATAAILAIAAVACYLPSRRAAAVDPVHALRAE